MNILSIGNSFSQDAQRYLHKIAKADGVVLNTFNLYIGGCSLYTHYKNMLCDEKAYILEMNGEGTGFTLSLKEGLLNREWDIVTLQQCSRYSTDYDTYQPYLNKLAEYIRLCVPRAKVVIHQIWAYEQDSDLLNTVMGYTDQSDMFNHQKIASEKAAKDIGADYIIPSGEVFQMLIAKGCKHIHRDTFHASLGLGRYALGLTWYKALTGKDIDGNTFNTFDEEIPPEQIVIAKKCATDAVKKYCS